MNYTYNGPGGLLLDQYELGAHHLDANWMLAKRREELRRPAPAYHHVEWPGPAPGAWDYSVFSSPTNPGNAASVTSRCTIDLVYEGTCKGDPSCVLGVVSAGDVGRIDIPPTIDPQQFALGQMLHKRCVQSQVQSYFGAWSTAS